GTKFRQRLDGAVGGTFREADQNLSKFKTSRPKELQSRPSVTTESEVKQAEDTGRVVSVPIEQLHVDPSRFQFKTAVDPQTGAGRELQDVPFNRQLAGVVSVWRDPSDGKTYVVNGHHRFDLAQRDGNVKDLDVRFIKAPDAESARAIGALTNIAEGRGSST